MFEYGYKTILKLCYLEFYKTTIKTLVHNYI